MMSILRRRSSDSNTFKLSWRGYNCTEVDEFLRQTSLDRQRIQEDLAQIEAVMAGSGEERRRELERLAALRTQVASCLETSIGALHTATRLLATIPQQDAPVPPAPGNEPGSNPLLALLARLPTGRVRLLIGGGAVLALTMIVLAYQYHGSANEMPASPTERTDVVAPEPAVSPESSGAAPAAPIAAAAQSDGLVITLTARRSCWIGTSIDGGQRLERVLKPEETIMVRANEEVVLRVGDAAALSVLINNQPTRPLGAAGQVVTTRITRTNYRSLLN